MLRLVAWQAVTTGYVAFAAVSRFSRQGVCNLQLPERCEQAGNGKLICRRVLVADLSPLFEKLPDDYSKSLRLTLNRELLTRNSVNHKRRGQNVLYGDGRAEFIKTRHADILEDDIYTLQNVDIYEGREVPTCETDFFLAP